MERFNNTMKIPTSSERDAQELNAVRNCELTMSRFKKMPDSVITRDDYHDGNIEEKRYNKFRSNYFQTLGGNCELLLLYMDNPEYKKEIEKTLLIIMNNVRQQAIKGRITEELIDEMDGLAKDLLKKIKSKLQ